MHFVIWQYLLLCSESKRNDNIISFSYQFVTLISYLLYVNITVVGLCLTDLHFSKSLQIVRFLNGHLRQMFCWRGIHGSYYFAKFISLLFPDPLCFYLFSLTFPDHSNHGDFFKAGCHSCCLVNYTKGSKGLLTCLAVFTCSSVRSLNANEEARRRCIRSFLTFSFSTVTKAL